MLPTSLYKLVRMPGFEPGTAWSVARCSIQLSHIRTVLIGLSAIFEISRPHKLTKSHGGVKESGIVRKPGSRAVRRVGRIKSGWRVRPSVNSLSGARDG